MASLDMWRYGIAKLSDDNYDTWSQKVELLMMREGLWQTVVNPPSATPTPEHDRLNEIAKATIGLLIEDKYLVDVKGITGAHEVWNKLKKVHQHTTTGARLVMYRQLFTAKFNEGDNMNDHLTFLLNTASRLRDMGHEVPEEILCAVMLGSLPHDYDALITAIEGGNSDGLSSTYIRAKIVEEHRRKTENRSVNTLHAKALYTPNRPNYRGNKPSPTCYYCQKVGHIRKDCRLLQRHEAHQNLQQGHRSEADSQPEQSKYVGSLQEDMHHDIMENHYPTSSASYQDFTHGQEHKALYVRDTTLTKERNQWIIDSGACNHMCMDSTIMTNYVKMKENIYVETAGRSRKKVLGTGNCTLDLKCNEGKNMVLTLKEVYHIPTLSDNLLSTSKLDDQGYLMLFKQGKVWILDEKRRTLLGGDEGQPICTHPG